MTKKTDQNQYVFHSLLNSDERQKIQIAIKNTQNGIVNFRFDQEPLSPINQPDISYFYHTFDPVTGETDLVKMDCKSLLCTEIYKSKFKIFHLAMMEHYNKSS